MEGLKVQILSKKDQVSNTSNNQVFRSSVLIPHIAGLKTSAAFLNHFKLKRGISSVACKVSAYEQGKRVAENSFQVTETKAYVIQFDQMFDRNFENGTVFEIEFFCSENIGVPYPAVMINHLSQTSFNAVHAFSRFFNDVHEYNSQANFKVLETSFDTVISEEKNTFFTVISGMEPLVANIQVKLKDNAIAGDSTIASIPINAKRLTATVVSFDSLMLDSSKLNNASLSICLPDQTMLYQRMLVGTMSKDGGMTANHSYYDSSSVKEYFEDASLSSRSYVFIPELTNKVRMYPCASPGVYPCYLQINMLTGECKRFHLGSFHSPGKSFIEADVDQLILQGKLDRANVASFDFEVHPDGHQTSTRFGHQVIYASLEKSNSLPASINFLLKNKNNMSQTLNGSRIWGQIFLSTDYDTWLAITNEQFVKGQFNINISFYSNSGKVSTQKIKSNKQGVLKLSSEEILESNQISLLKSNDNGMIVWYWIESEKSHLHCLSISKNKQSGHCTAEHNF